MSSKQRNKLIPSLKRKCSRTTKLHSRLCNRRNTYKNFVNVGRREEKQVGVSEKLEALKNLIPTKNEETRKADQLFEETADYIVFLRTQVEVLQRLIDIYGSNEQKKVV
ncbi:hypothetical protein IFM89_008088 [Coptis chinensis]|uniref:Uncharacterized protein n=1 Tax=Coptis chinensis TaxID=261450 RepID=A0A835IUN4_9MAGN|nr:hypothetical protein IFM89_008088 [Coptis chinensis]